MWVESLSGEAFALQQYVVVEIGKYGGIEPYAVFDEQNHLYSCLVDVVVDIHLVLYQFYDGEDEVGVAKPAEDVVEHREILVLHTSGYAVREWREHYARNVWRVGLYLSCHVEGIVVGISRHADYEVDVGVAQHLVCLFRSADLCEGWRIAQAEIHIFVKNFLVNASVVFEHESVVGVGDDEHVEDASCHEIDERHVAQIEFIPFLWYV